MESELNKAIRETLEAFGVDTKKVVGEWNIIGHLKNAVLVVIKRAIKNL